METSNRRSASSTLCKHDMFHQLYRVKASSEPKNYSYPPSVGLKKTREGIANAVNKTYCRNKVSFDDIILTSGCSGAIELTLKALLGTSKSILIPNPAFGLYEVVLNSASLKFGRYLLIPERDCEVDLAYLRRMLEADPSIEAILVNNPSNPCGTVFSESHIHDILQLASAFSVIVVADEIYGDIVYEGSKFYPFAQIRDEYNIQVDIITLSGIAKELCVPGVRLGWVIFNEVNKGRLANVKQGVKNLTMLSMGPNSIVQHALEMIVGSPELEVYKTQLAKQLQRQSDFFVKGINSINLKHPNLGVSLSASQAQGAMYVLVRIKSQNTNLNLETKTSGSDSDSSFDTKMTGMQLFKELKSQQNVSFLPGCIFGDSIADCLRAVIVAPENVLTEVLNRIEEYCIQNHSLNSL